MSVVDEFFNNPQNFSQDGVPVLDIQPIEPTEPAPIVENPEPDGDPEASFKESDPEKEKARLQSEQDELEGLIYGSMAGAAEAVGETAEVIGDTAKTLFSKAFPDLYTVAEKDDVFSNKYEWAKWDLGKDQYGAQSGTGKVLQEFAEFGIIMAGTGGLAGKGLVGAAAAGAAADMITTNAGDSNMSNLIKENAPEWYPDWLTILAVEEDDGPWEAKLKTVLEGAGMGALIDSAMGYVRGRRAARIKRLAGGDEAAQQKAALEAASATIDNASPEAAAPDGVMSEYMQAGGKGDENDLARLTVVDQANKGIPVAWDDIANAEKQMFTPGERGFEMPNFAAGTLDSPGVKNPITGEEIIVNTRGKGQYFDDSASDAEINPEKLQSAVAIDGEHLVDTSADSVGEFIARNYDILTREDAAIRVNPDNSVDLVRVVDPAEAQRLGRLFDDPNYGGTGKLTETKGRHLGSPQDNPSLIRATVTPTEQAWQQTDRLRLGNPAGSSPAVTEAQMHLLSNGTTKEGEAVLRKIVSENPVEFKSLSKYSQIPEEKLINDAGKGIAAALGANGDSIDFSKILKQKVGDDELLSGAGIVQVRGLLQAQADRIALLGKELRAASDNARPLAGRWTQLASDMKELLKVHKISANTSSKYLRTYKVQVPDLNMEILDEFMPASGEQLSAGIDAAVKHIDEVTAGVQRGDPKAVKEAVTLGQALQLTGGDLSKVVQMSETPWKLAGNQALTMMYNSMLSSPETHVVSNLSNLINTFYRPIAAAVGGDMKTRKQAAMAMHGFGEMLSDAWTMAGKTWDGGKTQGNKGFVSRGGDTRAALDILSKKASASGDPGLRAAVGFMNALDFMANNPMFSWPSKLLTSSDEFFKVMISRMEYNSKIMGEAIDLAADTGRPTEVIFEELYKKNLSRNFTKDGGILNEDLLNVAKEATFQTDLEGMAKVFGDAINKLPFLRPFLPFVKTGHNVLVFTGQHVPILSRALKETQAIRAGTDEYAKAVIKGREATGAFVMLSAAVAAHAGLITGNGPVHDREKYETWETTNQPRSIKLPNGEHWSYERIEPFAMLLSSVADVVDGYRSGELSENQAQHLAGYLSMAIGVNLTNKSMFAGVAPLSQLLNPRSRDLAGMAAIPANAVNNFLPYSGARRAFANAFTAYQQEFKNMFERFIHGASAGLIRPGADKIDWLDGSKMENPNGGLDAINPLNVTKRGVSVVRDALEDMEYDYSRMSKEINEQELSNEQLQEVHRIMGKSDLHDRLEDIVTNPAWRDNLNEYKEKLKQGITGTRRAEYFYDEVHSLITEYRAWARDQMLTQSPELADNILKQKALIDSVRRGEAKTEYRSRDLESLRPLIGNGNN